MTEIDTETTIIRRRINDLSELHDTATVDEIVAGVSRDLGVADATVVEELDRMERNGFVYLVSTDGGEQEVRLP
jgi:predicted transcriptional regulator